MQAARLFLLSAVACLSVTTCCIAKEGQTLLGAISEWQYPGSKIGPATMADGATLKADGERALPSIVCTTVMTTSDPVEKVVEHYKKRLSRAVDSATAKADKKPQDDMPRSVAFHEDSAGRALSIHIILVNTPQTSTTLVISRGASEAETHIAWTQYQKY